jgi:hypothetical protein
MSGLFMPLMSASTHERNFFSAHEQMIMSGERKIILFNLYDHILLQPYFRPLIWNFDTLYDPTGYFRPNYGHFYRLLTLLTTLRAISDIN